MRPTTVFEAKKSGYKAFVDGHSIHYNPYRNTDLSDSQLYCAWFDGWNFAAKLEKNKDVVKNIYIENLGCE